MENKTEKLYRIGEVAELLGIHEDTLRNWEQHGLVIPNRIGKRKDRRYTAEHIKQIREQGLISDLAKRQPSIKDYSSYTKERLIKELQILDKQKKYGLVWEDKPEEVVEKCKREAPILKSIGSRRIKDKDVSKPNNILIEGDNYHALQVLNYTHKEKVDVIYIDPPYNTGARNWKYNNDYVDKEDTFRHSKWLSMMNRRLILAKSLLKSDGALICAIDENEVHHLGVMIKELFPEYENHCITIVHNPRGIIGSNFSYTHEYAYFVFPIGKKIIGKRKIEKEDVDYNNLRNWGSESAREDAQNCFYPIIVDKQTNKVIGFGEVCEDNFHPTVNIYKEDSVEIYPVDKSGTERKWRYARQSVEGIKDLLKVKKSKGIYDIQVGKDFGTYRTVWIDNKYDANEYGTKILRRILPDCSFEFPKSLHTVYDCLFAVIGNRPQAVVLDFFAGSGTTGHAVMELNKEDGGNRQFILCTNNENNNGDEHGGIAVSVCYPRIKKVIEGYKKNGDGEEVEGLGGSLEYFKTEFVDVENIAQIPDDKRLEFTHEAGYVIALKENAFNEIERNEFYQIFTDEKGKYVGLYFRENLEKISELEGKILDKQEVKLYIFSDSKNSDWKDDYKDYKNISVEDIPEPILKVYRGLNV